MKKFAILAALAATPAFADQPVTINFAAEIGGQPFACDATYPGLGSTGTEVKGTDFRLYVSDVAMVAADGSRAPVALDESDWQHAGVALLDFEDGRVACANGTAPMNTSGPISRMNLVIQSPTSVAPATSVAPGCSV
jgi:hypothetical protein